MSTNSKAKMYPFERAEKKIIRQQKVIRTTLGDLIAAVTDEVRRFVRNPSGQYMVVSYIVNDVLSRHRLRAHKRSLRRYSTHFA